MGAIDECTSPPPTHTRIHQGVLHKPLLVSLMHFASTCMPPWFAVSTTPPPNPPTPHLIIHRFGFTAFTTYGAFWMSFSIYSILTRVPGINGQPVLQPSLNGEQFMLGAFSIITFIFMLCTFAMNAMLTALFFTLTCLFALLAWGVDNHTAHQFAG